MGRWRGFKLNRLIRTRWSRESGIVAALAGAPAASEAAFLQPEGTTQLISASSVSSFSRSFDAKGRLKRSATFSKSSLDVHVAHGLTEHISLIATASSDRLTSKFANDPGSAFGWSAMAGLRIPLWQADGGIISAQALAGIGRDVSRGSFVGEARVLAGRNLSIGGVLGFADAQLAWRQNAPGTQPELRFDATLGLKPLERVMVLAQLFSAYGLPDAGQKRSFRVKGQFGLVWHVGETWSVQANGFHTLYGLNTAQETGATLSLWRRF